MLVNGGPLRSDLSPSVLVPGNREQAREWYQRAFDASNGLDTESVIVRPQAAEWLARNR